MITDNHTLIHPVIGIVGLGVVGGAIASAINNRVTKIDINPEKNNGTYSDLLNCDGVFVCVPSPTSINGHCDTSILEQVLEKLSAMNYSGVIISKVTAPPSVYSMLASKYKNLVYSPEFLTEASAGSDYLHATKAIIGGRVTAYVNEAERIMSYCQTNLRTIIKCSIESAALTKYTVNAFLALKVVFMNEICQLATASNIEYDDIALMMSEDARIGTSHLRVPGPDGKFGFGGMCFPKDTEALLKYAESVNIELSVLTAAVKKNTFLRLQDK